MATPVDPEDLTARARIRDAAIRHFGERGYEGATLRGIAETAGVSLGLVRHHFGSKQGLREACDEHLLTMIRRVNDETRAGLASGALGSVIAARAAVGPYRHYMARALAEGSATALFDELARLSEEWLTEADRDRPDPPRVDARARAAVGTAMALSVGILHEHISRAMGVDVFSPEGDRLLARALIDIHSHPMLGREDAERILAALDEAESGPPEESRDD
ncbi:TetR/AcrR family transcriptional regulator [Planobispora siamensis]|uniref:TetR/AcrR family transcriptional regulator n=1 Tax=Planobispora siamensis TaxID=936338 RepID=UPI0023B28461|nr:TetR/AcrR family transcriptional regulator [Planobispora siamensis]